MLFRIIFVLGILLNISNAVIVEQIEVGKTYQFAEKDFISAIHEYIKNNKVKIEKKLNKIRKEAVKKIKNFKPQGVRPLTPTLKNRVFYPDMTYTLKFDIKDQYGKVIYPKGYKFNPTKYVKLTYSIIVINGNNKKEVNWLLHSKYIGSIAYRIFLTDGSWYEIMKKIKQPVYYALPQIEDRFKLEHTPSIITQIGDKIQVKEICLECNSTKKYH